MAKRYGILGTIETLQIGSADYGFVTFVDLENLLTLGTGCGGNGFSTYRNHNASAGYTVTALKTLQLKALSVRELSNVNKAIQVGYGDTDVGLNSLTPPTNPVYCFGGSLTANNIALLFLGAATQRSAPIRFDVIAGKYPFNEGAGSSGTIYGYEV